jgi:hypothetical protein
VGHLRNRFAKLSGRLTTHIGFRCGVHCVHRTYGVCVRTARLS